MGLLYKDFAEQALTTKEAILDKQTKLEANLIKLLLCHPHNKGLGPTSVSQQFFTQLGETYDKLQQDAFAIYKGDPAATAISEVIRNYPGFYATAAYRIAHSLHKLGVVDLPRIITEHAHSMTGIDIHPGATIGRYFCIDHGTGIVIGETTEIGNNVKLYQGVTLGALSVKKENANQKRHPIIEDGVVIYAGATILGGKTVIGHDSIIGGNVWITQSVPAFSKIYNEVGQQTLGKVL